jgi:glycosyltransferase involved in cell wall biosynthesis
MAASGKQFRIGLISDSIIANDPRLRRQGDALFAAGFDVVAVGQGATGTGGDGFPATDWPVKAIRPASAEATGLTRKVRRLADVALQRVKPAHAHDVYWRLNPRHYALAEAARDEPVDLWLANDWTSLPVVMDIKRRLGTPFAYDTHELAVDEYAQSLQWRLSMRPVIATVEREGLQSAQFVTCVSDGIAVRLQQFYQLTRRPHVIRNMPRLEVGLLRPTGNAISVLYHGVIVPGRALEESIVSVAQWRPEFTLTLRGPSEAAYIESLQALAQQHGIAERVHVAPPVPMTELVGKARAHDVGLFVIKGHSRQNEHVLPNKFFEYAMAGLALCVSDLPEMRGLLQRHGLGVLIADVTPEAIANAINALDPARIDAFKANALTAARELCWEKESDTLVALVRAALEGRTSSG